jgi:phosphohistidine phosphatase SixA
MKRLFLIRHGNTTKNKAATDRGLTKTGMRKIKQTALQLNRLLQPGAIQIICPAARRTIQSAEILRSVFCPGNTLQLEDLRVQGIEALKKVIAANEKLGIRPAQTYLGLHRGEFPEVETPAALYSRWLAIFNKITAENIIAISHEGSLEGFVSCLDSRQIITKSFDTYCDYGDFVIADIG